MSKIDHLIIAALSLIQKVNAMRFNQSFQMHLDVETDLCLERTTPVDPAKPGSY